MSFKDIKKLRSILACPDTSRRIVWFGNRGYSFGAKRKIIRQGNSFIFVSEDLPDNYQNPEYESSNPYQQRSLELIKEYKNGIVLDLGAGNPKHSFSNVCQLEIRKYPDTDIVVTEGILPLKSNSVDAVISEAVLEHVKNPFLYVSEIYRVLKNGGKVLLDTAFMQPLHGFPHHYFNTTIYAVKLLFEIFEIEKLHVGPHQHPWQALLWILNSYYSGIKTESDREKFKSMKIGEALDILNSHQSLRTDIKANNDPWYVATKLKSFNVDHYKTLGCFLNITPHCEHELAAGFQVYAKK